MPLIYKQPRNNFRGWAPGHMATIIKNSTHAVTLTPDHPNVTITGTIHAKGDAGTYTSYGQPVTFAAALFAPDTQNFTITNIGAILNKGKGTGIVLGAPGTLINKGLIQGGDDKLVSPDTVFGYAATDVKNTGTIVDIGAGSQILNTGSILSYGADIYIQSNGTIRNAGLIGGDNPGHLGHGGIFLEHNAALTNQSTGIISGSTGVYFRDGIVNNAGTITGAFDAIDMAPDLPGNPGATTTNTGTITGGENGVAINRGGTLINHGFIAGAKDGVVVYTYGGTIINAGTIVGDSAGATGNFNFAVQFLQNNNNRLVLRAGSDIIGSVSGGGGVLELDDTKSNFNAASLTQFADFTTLQIDSGTTTDLAGNLTIAPTLTVLNDGRIKESATDTITIDSGITGTGTIDLSKTALTLDGPVAATQTIAFTGTGETLALGTPGSFAAAIEHFAAGDTIDLTGISLSSITATQFAGGVLTLTETSGSLTLTFANPGSFGTDTFSLFADGANTGITLSAPTTLAANQNTPGWLNNNFVPTPSSAISLVTLQA